MNCDGERLRGRGLELYLRGKLRVSRSLDFTFCTIDPRILQVAAIKIMFAFWALGFFGAFGPAPPLARTGKACVVFV